MALTQRPFPNVSELQLCENGVFVVSRHRGAVDAAVRASVRRASEPRQFRDCAPRRRSGTTTWSRSRACRYRGKKRVCRDRASTSPARSSGWTSSSSRCTPWRLFRRYAYPFPTVTTDSIVVGLSPWHLGEAWRVDGVERVPSASRARPGVRWGRVDPYAVDATYLYILNPSPPNTAPAPPRRPPSRRGSPRPCRSRAANTRPRRRRRRPWPPTHSIRRRSITRRRPPRAVLVTRRRR